MRDFFSKMVHRETTIYAEYDDALNYEKNEQVTAPHEKTRRDFQIRPRISKRGSVRRFVGSFACPFRLREKTHFMEIFGRGETQQQIN